MGLLKVQCIIETKIESFSLVMTRNLLKNPPEFLKLKGGFFYYIVITGLSLSQIDSLF